MSLRHLIVFMAVSCILAVSAFAGPQDTPDGKELYTKGDALLKKGDFDGAFQAFSAAAKANPENQKYEMQAMMVRRAQNLRKFVNESEASSQWEKAVISLHTFYLTNEIYGEAVVLNRMAHKKMNNAMSASLLAVSLLEAGEDDEALALLQGLGEDKVDQQNRIYLGVALGRKGRLEEAKTVRKEITVDHETHISLLFDVARLDTLIGDQEGACNLLTGCFEKTLPSQLAVVKSHVNRCKDFNSLRGKPAFAAAMKTRSKVEESSCSGGSSCGSCPSRGTCGSQPKAENHGSGSCENSDGCDKSSSGCENSGGCDKSSSGCENSGGSK